MRWRLGVWLIVMAGLSIMVGQPGRASAETGGYPFGNKPCVHAPYGVYSTKVNWCSNYDWGDRRDDTSRANVISPYGYYYRNCTDYVAWKVASLGVAPDQYKGLGNAKQWAVPPAKNGLWIDNLPAVGAAAVRTTGEYGHVAFVESVDPSGSITVSEYNKHADGNFSIRSGMPAALGFTHFVHFEAYMPVLTIPPEAVPSVPASAVPAMPEPEITPAPEKPVDAPMPSQADATPLPAGRSRASQTEGAPVGEQSLSPAVQSVGPEVSAVSQPMNFALAAESTVGSERNPQPQQQSINSVESLSSQNTAQPTEPPMLPEQTPDAPLATALPGNVAAVLEQPIAASILPVPHQWWRPSMQSPPSTPVVGGRYAEMLAQQYVSPFGYWALGGLMAVTLIREYYPAIGLRYRYRWSIGR